jgi:transcription antitermination factor NusG
VTENGGALNSRAPEGKSEVNFTQPGAWFAVRTQSRHEKTANRQLEFAGFETLLPLYSEERKWSDRKKTVNLPFFPGYIFVRLGDFPSYRVKVLRTPGVIDFVGKGGESGQIAEEEINNIRLLLSEGVFCRPHPYLAVGQRVRIRDGALAGIEGILTRVNNDHSLILTLDLIQRSLSVKIQGFAVESISTRSN